MLNQHTMMGIAEYVPEVIMKSAPYCTSLLSWMEVTMAKPQMDMMMQRTA
jgi:hypothetical protein